MIHRHKKKYLSQTKKLLNFEKGNFSHRELREQRLLLKPSLKPFLWPSWTWIYTSLNILSDFLFVCLSARVGRFGCCGLIWMVLTSFSPGFRPWFHLINTTKTWTRPLVIGESNFFFFFLSDFWLAEKLDEWKKK